MMLMTKFLSLRHKNNVNCGNFCINSLLFADSNIDRVKLISQHLAYKSFIARDN